MSDDEPRKIIANLLAKHGPDKVLHDVRREIANLKPSRRGQPAFGFAKNAFIYALMVVLIDGGQMSATQASRWIARNAGVCVRRWRYGNPWRKNVNNAGSIRRTFYRTRTRFLTDEAFQQQVGLSFCTLLFWLDMALGGVGKPQWGAGGALGGEWHIDFAPKNPQILIEALENLRAIFEAIAGKQMRFKLPPEVRT